MNSLQTLENNLQTLEPEFQRLTLSNEAKVIFAKELHFAMQAMQKNDYLASIASKNPTSLRNAILNVAAVGLTLNPVEKQAYLVPRDGAVQLDISYMGLCDVATQEGALDLVKANLVHENDEFEFTGATKEPKHSFNPFGKNRGPVIGVYCVAKTPGGDFLTETMTIEECHAIRNRTDIWKKKQSGPWKTDEGEMMKKTVIKRASKLWPKPKNALRLQSAVDILHATEGIDFEEEEREAQAIREKEIEEKQLKAKEAREEKELVFEAIKEISGILTQGMEQEEKAEFVTGVLKVSRVSDLQKRSLSELQTLYDELQAKKDEGATTIDVEAQTELPNYAPGASNANPS